MKTDKTKSEFAAILLGLAEEYPLDQISISKIVDRSGKNRNTYYYHFQDKTSLIIWLLRRDLADQLLQANPSVNLLFSTDDPVFSKMPYYAREITGIRTVNTSFFLKSFLTALEMRRPFYLQVFSGASRTEVVTYLSDLLRAGMSEDLNIILSGRYLPPNDRLLIVDYHVAGLIGFLEHALNNPNFNISSFKSARFLNLISDSMSFEIENRRF